jgi:thiamine-monophosphate kinase
MGGRLRTIAELGEFGLLSQIVPHVPVRAGTIVGPGQDCAVVRCGKPDCLVTVDALVEGVHFESGWLSPHQLGRRSFLVNASDIAAMGGRPRFGVISLGVPASYPVRHLLALQAGIEAAARDCGASIVGGNLTRAERLFVSIALLGEAPRRLITRRGARRGDRVYVTGTLGDAAAGVALLKTERRGAGARHAIRRYREPTPRLQAGRLLVERGIVSAMVDVSDGLVQDLGHICDQSGVGAQVHTDRIPVSAGCRRLTAPEGELALHGGEDYELVCTVSERNVPQLERLKKRLGCPITCIGEITAGGGVRLVDAQGRMRALRSGGYDHFRG